MADELDKDNPTHGLGEDKPTHEPSEAITPLEFKDTMTMTDWQTLGISDLEPFRAIVRGKRRYKDKSPDDDRFEWVLNDINTLETEIIVQFRQLTGKNTIIIFTPAGWFVKQLEKEVIETTAPLHNPFRKVKDMVPPQVYEVARVYDPGDRNKIFEYIRRRILPFAGPEDNRRVFVSSASWRHIKDEDKEKAATAVMNGLGLSEFVLFDGSWFYLWLLHRARKNLSEERRNELLNQANEEERKVVVEPQVP